MKKTFLIISLVSGFCLTAGLLYASPFDFLKGKFFQASGMSMERIKEIIDHIIDREILSCVTAESTYNSVKEAYDAKKADCDTMEQAKKEWDTNIAISAELSRLSDTCQCCSDHINLRQMIIRAQRDRARDTFWAKFEGCYGEGPSLEALKMAMKEAGNGVCDACNHPPEDDRMNCPSRVFDEHSGVMKDLNEGAVKNLR